MSLNACACALAFSLSFPLHPGLSAKFAFALMVYKQGYDSRDT
jgi:hypothetical protein